MTEENLMKDVVLSPELVEEKLIDQRIYQITMTGGGKFRTYYEQHCSTCASMHRTSTGVYDTLEEAQHHSATQMNLQSALVLKPSTVLAFIFEQITGKKPPKMDDDDA